MKYEINPQVLLKDAGFNADMVKRLRGTHKSIVIRWRDSGGAQARVVRLMNHYFGGVNYWEYRPSLLRDTTRLYFMGETFKDLVLADPDFEIIVDDPEYLDYIEKFDPWKPAAVINLTYAPHHSYKEMPKPPRQDNKAIKVGSGNGYLRDARFPSKKRGKSTWKRFWKLFPQFDGCKTMEEYRQKQFLKMRAELLADKDDIYGK